MTRRLNLETSIQHIWFIDIYSVTFRRNCSTMVTQIWQAFLICYIFETIYCVCFRNCYCICRNMLFIYFFSYRTGYFLIRKNIYPYFIFNLVLFGIFVWIYRSCRLIFNLKILLLETNIAEEELMSYKLSLVFEWAFNTMCVKATSVIHFYLIFSSKFVALNIVVFPVVLC